MTLEDCDCNYNSQNMLQQCAGQLVADVLQMAQTQNRIIQGMYSSAKQLGSNPQNVTFCILPQNHLNDVEKHLSHMLMEAFCNENDIYKLKVDCEEKLADILQTTVQTKESDANDFSCILIQQCWSNEDSCWKEEELIRMMEETGLGSQIIIELPPD